MTYVRLSGISISCEFGKSAARRRAWSNGNIGSPVAHARVTAPEKALIAGTARNVSAGSREAVTAAAWRRVAEFGQECSEYGGLLGIGDWLLADRFEEDAQAGFRRKRPEHRTTEAWTDLAQLDEHPKLAGREVLVTVTVGEDQAADP